MSRYLSLLSFFCLLLSSCASQPPLPAEEHAGRDRAEAAVSRILADHHMVNLATYRVYDDGRVEVYFAKDLNERQFTPVVTALRADQAITRVWAEQEGVAVCTSPDSATKP